MGAPPSRGIWDMLVIKFHPESKTPPTAPIHIHYNGSKCVVVGSFGETQRIQKPATFASILRRSRARRNSHVAEASITCTMPAMSLQQFLHIFQVMGKQR